MHIHRKQPYGTTFQAMCSRKNGDTEDKNNAHNGWK